MISRPVRSSCRARASTSNADSVPSRAILGATFMEVLLAGYRPRNRRRLTRRVKAPYYKRVDFVSVPAGRFAMGWPAGQPCERPRHLVWVDAFKIARTPATNAEFAAYAQ